MNTEDFPIFLAKCQKAFVNGKLLRLTTETKQGLAGVYLDAYSTVRVDDCTWMIQTRVAHIPKEALPTWEIKFV